MVDRKKSNGRQVSVDRQMNKLCGCVYLRSPEKCLGAAILAYLYLCLYELKTFGQCVTLIPKCVYVISIPLSILKIFGVLIK